MEGNGSPMMGQPVVNGTEHGHDVEMKDELVPEVNSGNYPRYCVILTYNFPAFISPCLPTARDKRFGTTSTTS